MNQATINLLVAHADLGAAVGGWLGDIGADLVDTKEKSEAERTAFNQLCGQHSLTTDQINLKAVVDVAWSSQITSLLGGS